MMKNVSLLLAVFLPVLIFVQDLALELFDMNGRAVAALFYADVEAIVEYRSDFKDAALPNGVYIYRITTEREEVMEKFIIVR